MEARERLAIAGECSAYAFQGEFWSLGPSGEECVVKLSNESCLYTGCLRLWLDRHYLEGRMWMGNVFTRFDNEWVRVEIFTAFEPMASTNGIQGERSVV